MAEDVKLYTQSDVDTVVELKTIELERLLKKERHERRRLAQQNRELRAKIKQLELV